MFPFQTRGITSSKTLLCARLRSVKGAFRETDRWPTMPPTGPRGAVHYRGVLDSSVSWCSLQEVTPHFASVETRPRRQRAPFSAEVWVTMPTRIRFLISALVATAILLTFGSQAHAMPEPVGPIHDPSPAAVYAQARNVAANAVRKRVLTALSAKKSAIFYYANGTKHKIAVVENKIILDGKWIRLSGGSSAASPTAGSAESSGELSEKEIKELSEQPSEVIADDPSDGISEPPSDAAAEFAGVVCKFKIAAVIAAVLSLGAVAIGFFVAPLAASTSVALAGLTFSAGTWTGIAASLGSLGILADLIHNLVC